MASTNAEAGLSELFHYPFLWSPGKILSFFICLRKKLGHLKKLNPTFWKNLNQAAKDLGILEYKRLEDETEEAGQWDWGKGFSSKELYVLVAYYNPNGEKEKETRYKFDHVTDLVVAFRHRQEHQIEIPDADKELLFGTKNLTDQVYVSLWIRKFPKLLGFLWINFLPVKRYEELTEEGTDLTEYYPEGIMLENEINKTDVSWFLEKLNRAVAGIKSHGFQEGRYTINGKTFVFYELSPSLLHNIFVSGSSATTIRISGDKVTVSWSTVENSLTHTGEKSQSRTLIFSDKLEWNHVQSAITGSSKKVQYFASDLSNISKALDKISGMLKSEVREHPLTLTELDDDVLQILLSRKVSVWKESEMFELWSILSPLEIEQNIWGKDLNQLLRGSEFCMFKKVSLPRIDQSVYLPRNISLFQQTEETMSVSETRFCDKILKRQDPWQIVCVSGKCGMGKSKTIESMARYIYEKACDKFVFLFPMRNFFQTSDIRTDLTKRDVITIFHTILCEKESERNLISHWLSSQTIVQRIKLEIIFDGLDEIPEEYLESLHQIIMLIRENCPCVRQWITSRDHMIEELLRRFEINIYQLVPLTSGESVKLTKRYVSLSVSEKFGREEFKKLELFWSEKCISFLKAIQSDLTSVPLHCEMLANFLACNLTPQSSNEDFASILSTLGQSNYKVLMVDIFEHVMKQKCEYFLQKMNIEQADSVQNYTRKLYLTDIMRWATVLALECLYGKQVRNSFETRIIHDELVKKYVLNQGFVQSFNRLVFCHQSICEFIVAEFAFRVLSNDGYLGVNKHDVSFQNLFWHRIILKENDNPAGLFYWLCCKYSIEGKAELKLISKLYKDFLELEECFGYKYKDFRPKSDERREQLEKEKRLEKKT